MMSKFDELPAEQKRYIQTAMEKVGVNPWLVSEADIDRMLESYEPDNGWFQKEYRSNEIISADRRKRAEAAPDFPLPSEDERRDFAKKFGVVPALVPTEEKRAAAKLAAEQLEQFETASSERDTFTLTRIGDDKNNPNWQAARDRIAQYFPAYDSWKD